MSFKEKFNYKHVFYVCSVLAIVYVIAPSVVFMNDILGWEFPSAILEKARYVEKMQFAYLAIFAAVVWIIAFVFSLIERKYNLHDTAGIIGVFASLASLSAMTFTEHKVLAISFAASGFLCVYCISVPLYTWFQSKLKQRAWETAFLGLVLGGSLSYILSGYSGIMINEIFKVNSDYFSFTKPIAMYLILTPYISVLSAVAIVCIVIVETRKNKIPPQKENDSNEKVEQEQKQELELEQTDGTRSFYNINKILACYVILIISMASGSRASSVIELVSSTFDFDPKTHCKLDKEYDGYIVLDPAHSKVLTYDKGAEIPYVINNCKI
ncbi:hypothetical protein ACS87_13575 [Vibrio parahaemolyticus]|uniref:hypothetical protein n=1 Tax=Vibrio parahaemolyticus TaxID=670 RepID=UPI0006A58AD2|nr:hypothetical protein [Vibrio parahaemolyticus]KOE76303.1 hypothetical protein ACS87_13575 [Vibrio parahaemolyticus]